MTTIYKVNLAFADDPDADLVSFAYGIVSGMTANPSFPSPPLDPVTGLKPLVVTFETAITAALQGGSGLISARKDARKALMAGLRQEAGYVQFIAELDETMMLSSGFLTNSTNRASVPLATPSIMAIVNGNSGELILRLKGVNNAASYEVQYRIGIGAWIPAGVYRQSRGIVVEGLTPGVVYTFQVRGVGGSTQYGGWSDPVSHMSM